MAQNSKIGWLMEQPDQNIGQGHTVNLWWGCSKVHTGCKNCYAQTFSHRVGNDIWGDNKSRKLVHSAFNDLDKYQRRAKKDNNRVKIFVGSMMDIFEDIKSVIDKDGDLISGNTGDFRTKLFERITKGMYENLIFLFLTKRPENISKMIPDDWSHGVKNVWFGTSVSDAETVKYADRLKMLKYQNLFLSIEPQVGEINEGDIDLKGINWVIQGGESGHNNRPFNIDWAYEMKSICKMYGVPYFFKQIDKKQPIPEDLQDRHFPYF